MIVRIHITDGRIDRVGLVPVVINEAREPVPYRADTEGGRAVRTYLAQITAEAGIDTTFDVVDDEVLVRASRSTVRMNRAPDPAGPGWEFG